MERKYRAFCDDGHDYFSFEFYSSHRAGSKANREDALATYHRTYGYRRKFNITSIERDNSL